MADGDYRMKSVECGICDKKFTDATVAEMAKAIARHWNDDHADEFISTRPFKTEEYGGRHLHGDEYAYTVKEYYITAYDVLDTSGGNCGPFAYEYVKKPEAEDVCEDCWRSIHNVDVDGYTELDTTDWRDKYLCDECKKRRQTDRRKEENQKITEWVS